MHKEDKEEQVEGEEQHDEEEEREEEEEEEEEEKSVAETCRSSSRNWFRIRKTRRKKVPRVLSRVQNQVIRLHCVATVC